MILLQNPNMPVPTNAVEIDAAILDIKGHLETGLTWLTNGYGRMISRDNAFFMW